MPWRFNPFTGNLDETDIPAFNGEVTLGSAASPSIFFTGDTNTGLYSPGADQVALSTNGTGQLFVDASGNVGINTAPSARLHIIDTDSSSAYTTGAILGTQTSIYKQIVHTNQSSGTNEAGIVLRAGTSSNIAEWGLSAQRTGTTGGDLIFRTRTGASSSNEFVRIDSSGRLLVGTSSDSGGALLQVNGNRIRVATAKTPASASDTGTAGEICWDASYVYVCTATNTWKRAALSTW